MKFNSPQAIEQCVWQMRLADFSRAVNRAKINDLFDGWPPYTEAEVEANRIAVNVNDPANSANLAHDARRQLDNSLLLPKPLFSVELDIGRPWERQKWEHIITKYANRALKKSRLYSSMQKSVNALCVMHGIGPSTYKDRKSVIPMSRNLEDVLIPADTYCDMDNLPLFAVYEEYTGPKLWEMTHGPHVDPAWNIPLAESAVKWVDDEARRLMGTKWPQTWSPEKLEQRIKQDAGLYASDAVPMIECWHFYYWDDSNRKAGWRKKIILDAWGNPGIGGVGGIPTKAKDALSVKQGRYGMDNAASKFLYDGKGRVYADDINQIVNFQYANCSNVARFRYHSVRSFGFLAYGVAHLQNRMQCKINEAAFEALMQYYRVNNVADADRALRIDLTDKLPIPEGVQFVRQDERWQVDAAMPEMAMKFNLRSLGSSSASYAKDFDTGGINETATAVMARLSTNLAMTTGFTNQAYESKKWQYQEICRRFCIRDNDTQVARKFRLDCLNAGVPLKAFNVEAWNCVPTRVIGGGNLALQMAMVDRVMAVYPKLPPASQAKAMRLYLAVTLGDYEIAEDWVPSAPEISSSVHDAQISSSALLNGSQLGLVQNVNHVQYAEAQLVALAAKIQEINARGGVATPAELQGMQLLAGQTITGAPLPGNGITAHLQIIAQDEKQPKRKGQMQDQSVRQTVKALGDHLKVLMNQVKAMAQRAAEMQKQAQARQGAQPGMDPKDQAKVAATIIQAKTKASLAAQSHAQRTAQRQLQFEQQMRQSQQEHEQDMALAAQEARNGQLRMLQE